MNLLDREIRNHYSVRNFILPALLLSIVYFAGFGLALLELGDASVFGLDYGLPESLKRMSAK